MLKRQRKKKSKKILKNSETSASERVGEKNKEKSKKHIVKHTTKKFKMSDFCFLFLSVEKTSARHTNGELERFHAIPGLKCELDAAR